jgi:hypothetical protein
VTPYRISPPPADAPFETVEERIMRHAINLSTRGLRARSVAIHPEDYRESLTRLGAKGDDSGYSMYTAAGSIRVKADPDIARFELRFDEIERSV